MIILLLAQLLLLLTTNESNNCNIYNNNNVIIIKIIIAMKMKSGCALKKIKNGYIYCLAHFSFSGKKFLISINSLSLSVFPLAYFHLVEANLVPRWILKNQKTLSRLPLIVKRCAGVKVELKPHYLLFRAI